MSTPRHIITPEYPPTTGGVSDYTQTIANGLAACGSEVHVWCPGQSGLVQECEVIVHRELGSFSPADLFRVGSQLNRFERPRQILVEWVPHGYGYRSLNLIFCIWLWWRAAVQRDTVEIFVHEPFLAFAGSYSQRAAALIHRLMIALVLQSSRRVWLSIPAWEEMLKPYSFKRAISFSWLPIPSNVPVTQDPRRVAGLRSRLTTGNGLIIGHFGTYGTPIKTMLTECLLPLLADTTDLSLVLLGRGSQHFRTQLISYNAEWESRIHASGTLSALELSLRIQACDLMLQPYPDGISTRRTSAMACLAHGKPVVSTAGSLTEPLWATSKAVVLTSCDKSNQMVGSALALLKDEECRERLGQLAANLYAENFSDLRTITELARHEYEIA